MHVLRARAGEEVTLFNGRGGEYAARITLVQRLRVTLDVLEHRPLERESPLHVVLLQGISSGERMEFTIRKAVELGVAEIRPVLAAASVARPKGERAASRQAHWQKIAIAACEQCGRNRIPQVHEVISIERILADKASYGILLSPRAELRFSEACRRIETAVTIAAGPEAGSVSGSTYAKALVALRMHVQTTLTLAVRARDALDAVGEVNDWNRSVEQLQAFMDSLPKER